MLNASIPKDLLSAAAKRDSRVTVTTVLTSMNANLAHTIVTSTPLASTSKVLSPVLVSSDMKEMDENVWTWMSASQAFITVTVTQPVQTGRATLVASVIRVSRVKVEGSV